MLKNELIMTKDIVIIRLLLFSLQDDKIVKALNNNKQIYF